tara:strand:- start:109 stop:519 length:411 start_codon:yes stop_codon:yes gene_type:complete
VVVAVEIILTQVTKKEHLVDQAAVEEEMVDLQVQVFNQTNLEILEHMVLVILEQAEQLLTLLDTVVAVVEPAAEDQAQLEEQEKLYLRFLVILEILDLILEEDLVVDFRHKVDRQQEVLDHQKEEPEQEINLTEMV